MNRKLWFAAALLGVGSLLFTPDFAAARGGGGGHGGGFGGGGFHSGGFNAGSFHSGGFNAGNSGGFNAAARSPGSFESHGPGMMSSNHMGSGQFGAFNHGAGNFQGDWHHTQSWNDWGRGQAWFRGRDFDHDHDFDHRFVFLPFWFPNWYGLYGVRYPYVYDYGYDSYGPDYYSSDYYGEPSGVVDDAAPTEPATASTTGSDGQQFAEQARESFHDGDYRTALRLAHHAAIEMPRDPAVHELLSLALFALKDYKGAAIEAHAALALGPPIDWPTLYTYYGNADTYTAQLRALEQFVHEKPTAAEGHFLLGYQYLVIGSPDAAKTELVQAVAETPKDELAERLLKQWK